MSDQQSPADKALRILIIEDDADFAEEVSDTLAPHGMTSLLAGTWKEAQAKLAAGPNAIILDQRLGATDTVPLLPEIRAVTNAPLLILTGNRQEADRIMALELGADDFLIKPISGGELVARVKALLRRAGTAPTPVSQGQPRIDITARRLTKADGTPIHLTSAEFDLLAKLAARPGQPHSRDDLMMEIFRRPWRPGDRAIDNVVMRLRDKLIAEGFGDCISTIRAQGYAFTGFSKS